LKVQTAPSPLHFFANGKNEYKAASEKAEESWLKAELHCGLSCHGFRVLFPAYFVILMIENLQVAPPEI
jgi:hypothetical protein